MCRSIEEGGQRCSAHTSAAWNSVEKSIRAFDVSVVTDEVREDLIDFASTPTGFSTLLKVEQEMYEHHRQHFRGDRANAMAMVRDIRLHGSIRRAANIEAARMIAAAMGKPVPARAEVDPDVYRFVDDVNFDLASISPDAAFTDQEISTMYKECLQEFDAKHGPVPADASEQDRLCMTGFRQLRASEMLRDKIDSSVEMRKAEAASKVLADLNVPLDEKIALIKAHNFMSSKDENVTSRISKFVHHLSDAEVEEMWQIDDPVIDKIIARVGLLGRRQRMPDGSFR